MEETKTVTPQVLAAAFVAMMKFHQSSLDMISALILLLREKEIVTVEDWRSALSRTKNSEESRNAWKGLEEISGNLETQSLLDMLKDFSGPIQ